jgi:translation elongation factor EF-Tu-like GTPase
VKLPPSTAFIEAEVELLTPEKGGRRTGIRSGYRCNCWLGNSDNDTSTYDAALYLLEIDVLQPGGKAVARVRPAVPDHWRRVEVGSTFELREGRRKIGHAVVRHLLSAKRQHSDNDS